MWSLAIIQIIGITKLNIVICSVKHMSPVFKLRNICVPCLSLEIRTWTGSIICSIGDIHSLTEFYVFTISWSFFSIRSVITLNASNIAVVLACYLQNSLKWTIWVDYIVVISCTIHSITERTLIISLLIEMIMNSSNRLVSFVIGVRKRFNSIELLLFIWLISFLITLTLTLASLELLLKTIVKIIVHKG